MQFVIVISKSMQRVKGHLRGGHVIIGYTRRGKEAARKLFEQHYEAIDRWILSAVHRLRGSGADVVSGDDAYQAGAEAAFLALHNYDPQKGELENYVRHSIALALKAHSRQESARGLTGTRGLYDRLRAASTEAEREGVLAEFPRHKEIDAEFARRGELETAAPSIEELIEGNEELVQREEFATGVEAELADKLKRLREYLAVREQQKKTWKRTQLAERRLKIFELSKLHGMMFRQIANELAIDVKTVHDDFKQISALIKEARGKGVFKAMTDPWQPEKIPESDLRRWRLQRLLFGLERLKVAVKENLPPAHVEFIRRVLAGLITKLLPDEAVQKALDGVRFDHAKAHEIQKLLPASEIKEIPIDDLKIKDKPSRRAMPIDPDKPIPPLLVGYDGTVLDGRHRTLNLRNQGYGGDVLAVVLKSLTAEQRTEFKRETELIRENKKKPEAEAPHKFKAANWTHPNGHPRCLICGDEEPEGGWCKQ